MLYLNMSNEQKQNKMDFQEIKKDLENGANFGNDAAGWYTLNNPSQKRRIIVFEAQDSQADEFRNYKTIDSYAKAIKRLINRGY